jgi:hypothetical protein
MIKSQQVVDNDVHVGLEALWASDSPTQDVRTRVDLEVLVRRDKMQVGIRLVHRNTIREVDTAKYERPSSPPLVFEVGNTVCGTH